MLSTGHKVLAVAWFFVGIGHSMLMMWAEGAPMVRGAALKAALGQGIVIGAVMFVGCLFWCGIRQSESRTHSSNSTDGDSR